MIRTLTAVLTDVARLRLPVTAAAVLATVLAIAAPFGVDVVPEQAAQITGALVGVGITAEFAQRYLGAKSTTTDVEPAPDPVRPTSST